LVLNDKEADDPGETALKKCYCGQPIRSVYNLQPSQICGLRSTV